MALIKHRPKVRVRCPPEVTLGVEFPIDVDLEATQEAPIEGVDVYVTGNAWSGKHALGEQRFHARATGPCTLPVGRSSFRVMATIPRDGSPTHAGTWIACSWEIAVHVDIDWWPDRWARFQLCVVAPPVDPDADVEPVLVATGQPAKDEPYFEVALDRRVICAEDQVAATIALGGAERHRYESVLVRMLLEERMPPGAAPSLTPRHEWRVPMPADLTRPIVFQFRVPEEVVPSHVTKQYLVGWRLEITAKVPWRGRIGVAIPVAVGRRANDAPGRPEVRRALPAVGSARVSALWAEVARQSGLAIDAEAMTLRVGDVAGTIRSELREKSHWLVADLAYPSLRLDLAVEASRGIRDAFATDFEIGERAIDERYRFAAREAQQTVAFARRFAHLLALWDIAVTMHDERATVTLRDSGMRRATLERFVAITREMAALLADREAIPVPPAIEPARWWADFARKLGGTFERGDASVRGERGGLSAAVETFWGERGEVRGTEVRVALTPELDAEPDPERLSADARALLGVVVAAAATAARSDGTIAPGEVPKTEPVPPALRRDAIVVRLPRPPHDPSVLLPLLDAMVALARALRVAQGPYR